VSTESTALSLGSNPLSSASSAPAHQGTIAKDEEESMMEPKEEGDDDDDDDDMSDVEEESAPQTAAERRAERRKMKRFRYDYLSAPVTPAVLELIIMIVLPINKRDF
jgi:hypothetical protein